MDKKIEHLIDALQEFIDVRTMVRGGPHALYTAEARERLRSALMKVLENY